MPVEAPLGTEARKRPVEYAEQRRGVRGAGCRTEADLSPSSWDDGLFRTIFSGDIDFNSRVATGVENHAPLYVRDGGHVEYGAASMGRRWGVGGWEGQVWLGDCLARARTVRSGEEYGRRWAAFLSL